MYTKLRNRVLECLLTIQYIYNYDIIPISKDEGQRRKSTNDSLVKDKCPFAFNIFYYQVKKFGAKDKVFILQKIFLYSYNLLKLSCHLTGISVFPRQNCICDQIFFHIDIYHIRSSNLHFRYMCLDVQSSYLSQFQPYSLRQLRF